MTPLAPNITWCAAESDSVPGSTWVSSGLSVSTPIVLIPSDMISSDLAGQVNNHGRTKHRDGCDVVSKVFAANVEGSGESIAEPHEQHVVIGTS